MLSDLSAYLQVLCELCTIVKSSWSLPSYEPGTTFWALHSHFCLQLTFSCWFPEPLALLSGLFPTGLCCTPVLPTASLSYQYKPLAWAWWYSCIVFDPAESSTWSPAPHSVAPVIEPESQKAKWETRWGLSACESQCPRNSCGMHGPAPGPLECTVSYSNVLLCICFFWVTVVEMHKNLNVSRKGKFATN